VKGNFPFCILILHKDLADAWKPKGKVVEVER